MSDRAEGLVPWCLLSRLQPSTEGTSGRGQDGGLAPCQELPSRSQRISSGRATACIWLGGRAAAAEEGTRDARGLLRRRRRRVEGVDLHPGHLYLGCRLGAQQQGGSAGRALRKRRAQRAAGAGTLGAGARQGSRPDRGSTQGQRRGPLLPAPKDFLDSKEPAVLLRTRQCDLGEAGLKATVVPELGCRGRVQKRT